MTSVLGPIIAKWQVETGALNTLETYLEAFLSELDREVFGSTTWVIPRPPAPGLQLPDDQGNDPGDPTSIYGGDDFESSDVDNAPLIIVVVEPDGEPEYFADGSYTATFTVEIEAQILGESETLARMYADLYGAAIASAILKGDPSLGGIAHTRLSEYTKPELDTVNPDDSLLAASLTTFTAYVDGVVNDDPAPVPLPGDSLSEPDPSQQPLAWPQVEVFEANVAATEDPEAYDWSPALEPSPTLYPGEEVITETADRFITLTEDFGAPDDG